MVRLLAKKIENYPCLFLNAFAILHQMYFNASYQRMQSLRDEIVELGMYMSNFKRLPYKLTSNQFVDFLWDTRSKAYSQKSFSGIHEYLQSLYYEWECVRNTLAEDHLPLVRRVVSRYGHRNLDFGDLMQEGFKGILRALDCFDVDFGVPFEVFAVPWIRKYISRLVVCNSEVIRIPESLVKNQRQGKRSAPAANIVDFSDKADNIEDGSENQEQHFLRKNTAKYLNECVESLRDQHRNVIRNRYFADGDGLQSLEKVGERCGHSRERARQLEIEALQTLVKKMENSHRIG